MKISGNNFQKGMRVYISQIPCEYRITEQNSEYTKISFQSPKLLDPGVKEVRIENPDGEFCVLSDVLSYERIDLKMFDTLNSQDRQPCIVALDPTLSPLEGTMIQITAQNIVEGVIVKVEEVICTNLTVKISRNNDPSRIIFKSPSFSQEGMKSVCIINPDQSQFFLEQALYYTSNKDLF